MTDLDICQKIAEIVFQESEMNGWDYSECGTFIVTGEDNEFNPLTDKALCFDLMVKHEVQVVLFSEEVDTGVLEYIASDINDNVVIYDKDPQRAIFLAIIAKHEGLNNE